MVDQDYLASSGRLFCLVANVCSLFLEVLKRYFDVCVWVDNPENVRKSADLDTSANPAKIRAELTSLWRIEEEKWLSGAFEWMNDWGTEARRRIE